MGFDKQRSFLAMDRLSKTKLQVNLFGVHCKTLCRVLAVLMTPNVASEIS